MVKTMGPNRAKNERRKVMETLALCETNLILLAHTSAWCCVVFQFPNISAASSATSQLDLEVCGSGGGSIHFALIA
ncbi:protein S100-G [Anopheles sinensis]|uniref:Protein S100-G n=1 Tax=Anopheles sinensis TaxID=74873 RepID=A0A084WJV7_ANOSI|nr:protein S100-G [Anopheles sinensis]